MAVKSPSSQALYQPKIRFDVLHLPGLGRLLRWRWGRLIFQAPLLILALLMLLLIPNYILISLLGFTDIWLDFRKLNTTKE